MTLLLNPNQQKGFFTKFLLFDKFDRKPDNKEIFRFQFCAFIVSNFAFAILLEPFVAIVVILARIIMVQPLELHQMNMLELFEKLHLSDDDFENWMASLGLFSFFFLFSISFSRPNPWLYVMRYLLPTYGR
jgi:hypothetical protein